MLIFSNEQKAVDIGNVTIGGQPGENSIVLIGTVFYAKHKALLDEKTGKFDKNILEKELNDFTKVIEETQLQGIIDVVGAYPEVLIKECEFIADIVDKPFKEEG